MAQLARDYEKLGIPPADFFRRAAASAHKRTPTLTTSELVVLATTFARAARIATVAGLDERSAPFSDAYPPEAAHLLGELAERILVERADALEGDELVRAVWAIATTGHASARTLAPLAHSLGSKATLDSITLASFARVAWSFAVAGGEPHPHVRARSSFGARCAAAARSARFDVRTTRGPLHQWALWLEETDCVEHAGSLAPPLRARLHEEYVAREAAKGVRTSVTHGEVRDCLRHMGLTVRNEVVTPLGYSVDMEVRLDEEDGGGGGPHLALLVEVDGPGHFLGGGRLPFGATQLKRRLLTRHAPLLSIDYWEWCALEAEGCGAEELARKRGSFLEARLSTLLREWAPPRAGGGGSGRSARASALRADSPLWPFAAS